MLEKAFDKDAKLSLISARFVSDWDGTVLVPHLSSIYEGESIDTEQHLLTLDTDTPFGDLNLSWISVLLRIGIVNRTIDDINRTFSVLDLSSKNNANATTPILLASYYENLVYLLKTLADRLIMLLSVIEARHRTKQYPGQIATDSIGALLKQDLNKFCGKVFKPNRHMLESLNIAANSYKHSFLNLQSTVIVMNNTPGVIVFYNPHNNSQNGSYVGSIIFVNTIREFDQLLTRSKEYILSIIRIEKASGIE